MARLIVLIATLALWAVPAQAQGVDTWSAHIREASAHFGVPEGWIRRVMRAESGGMTRSNGRPIVSRAGAMGLMQLMPGTWMSLRAQLGLGDNPHEPRDNILAGTLYLRMMYDRFGYPGLFAAYNAGPGRFARHLATGRRLPAETVAYVATLTRAGGHGEVGPGGVPVTEAPAGLFASRNDPPAAAETVQRDRRTIFVIRMASPPPT